MPVLRINFYSQAAKAKIKKPKKEVPSASEAQRRSLLESPASCSKRSVCLSSFADFCDPFVPKASPKQQQKFPRSLRTLFHESNSLLCPEEFSELCASTRRDLIITQDEITFVEQASRQQANSLVWHEQRAGRVTASRAHQVLHTSLTNPSVSLVKAICREKGAELNVPAIKWGRDHEPDALNFYKLSSQQSHGNVEVNTSGLLIDDTFPFIGASPDSIIKCSCCQGKGVVEVKCPFSFRCVTLDVAKQNKLCPISSKNELKETSPYFAQIQLQMYVSKAQYGDFVYWLPSDCIVTRVKRDDDFILRLVDKISLFWQAAVLPELLTRELEMTNKETAVTEKVYCNFKQETGEKK